MTQLTDAIVARRSASAKHLMAPGPDATTLDRILHVATRAPDHGRLVPYRFIQILDGSRERFADVLAASSREASPDIAEAEVDRAREKAFQGPCLIALIARIDPAHPKISASDQWLTVGCVLENMLLAIGDAGYAAAVRSGRYLDMQAVRSAFALGTDEHFTCFLAIGTASEWPPAKPKPTAESVTSRW